MSASKPPTEFEYLFRRHDLSLLRDPPVTHHCSKCNMTTLGSSFCYRCEPEWCNRENEYSNQEYNKRKIAESNVQMSEMRNDKEQYEGHIEIQGYFREKHTPSKDLSSMVDFKAWIVIYSTWCIAAWWFIERFIL